MQKQSQFEKFKEDETRNAINDYEFTCQTMVTFSHIISHDFKGTSKHGCKMKTSAENKISPNTVVTPDLRIEIPKTIDSPAYFAVNEVKVNLPNNRDFWMKDANQLKKYDDELGGWESDKPKTHDVMLTTNELRTYEFEKYLAQLAKEGQLSFSRNVALLHSTPLEQTNSFILIKRDHGKISHSGLNERLSQGIAVKRLHIIKEISQMKFCDHDPPVIYTMMIIWDHVVKTYLTLEQLRTLRGNITLLLDVNVEDVRKKLGHFAFENKMELIQAKWVKDALDGMVEIGIAKVLNASADLYQIKFRRRDEHDVEWLIKLVKESTAPAKKAESLDKFIPQKAVKEPSP